MLTSVVLQCALILGFTDNTTTSGKWFIQCKDEVTGQPDNVKKNNIFWRINESDYSDRQRSN